MRDFIIINGLSSTLIRGLLIQSLPPIRKPKMRTEVETVDGRDGDIITKLGYEAYDREIKIGLYGDYDVDEVISFFATSGKITLSNEPQKYYLFEQLDEIDFEKLLRWKEATFKIHVQPYKYSCVEDDFTLAVTDETSLEITNIGNVYSRPIINISGSGNISISLNGSEAFSIALGDAGSISIDTNLMKAYNGTSLMNRQVTGEYDDFVLPIGKNTLSWSGNVTSIGLEHYSRWR